MTRPRLLVMDVDSTLISQEVIELLAARAGSLELVAAVTERAMRGEIDFAASLEERVSTLAGLPVDVFADVAAEVEFTPGAPELIAAALDAGWTVGLVSGGFEEVVEGLASTLSVTHFVANRLEVADGVLTGRTTGAIIDRNAKAVALKSFARAAGIDLADAVAIGDGANDLGMMAEAGLSVAFAAKPVVNERADVAWPGPSMAGLWERISSR